ncbi:conserved membrane hypothetical protein [Candidatus Sulfopaludibacter sp. SbA4]|nr:conserved membrane hypothetical protein [Candidatus Sulfopaludibacter sp. SbA4]
MSWQLIARSFAVLRQDRKLALFPVLSALAGLALAALYFFSPIGDSLFRKSEPHTIGAAGYVSLLFGYFAFYFLMVFFNCALAACAQARFAGAELSLADGMRRAASRIQPILFWALLSGTLGILLQAIEHRVGFLGKIATRIFGFAWNMATYLVVPVLVIEDRGAVDSIRRSSGLLRKTWGEQLTVGICMGWIVLFFAIPGIAIGAIGAYSYPLLLPVAVLYFLVLIAVMTAVSGIFEVALYRYAVSGEVPDGYPPDMLNGAFVSRS